MLKKAAACAAGKGKNCSDKRQNQATNHVVDIRVLMIRGNEKKSSADRPAGLIWPRP